MAEIRADDQEIVRPGPIYEAWKVLHDGPRRNPSRGWSSHLANRTPGLPGVVTWRGSVFCAVMFSPARRIVGARLTFYRQGVIFVRGGRERRRAAWYWWLTDGPGSGIPGDDGMIIDRSLSGPEFHRLTSWHGPGMGGGGHMCHQPTEMAEYLDRVLPVLSSAYEMVSLDLSYILLAAKKQL